MYRDSPQESGIPEASRCRPLAHADVPARAQASTLPPLFSFRVSAVIAAPGLANLALEQPANIEVTCLSRRVERLSQARAPVYGISSEDIGRSGITSLREALWRAQINVARADTRSARSAPAGSTAPLTTRQRGV